MDEVIAGSARPSQFAGNPNRGDPSPICGCSAVAFHRNISNCGQLYPIQSDSLLNFNRTGCVCSALAQTEFTAALPSLGVSRHPNDFLGSQHLDVIPNAQSNFDPDTVVVGLSYDVIRTGSLFSFCKKEAAKRLTLIPKYHLPRCSRFRVTTGSNFE